MSRYGCVEEGRNAERQSASLQRVLDPIEAGSKQTVLTSSPGVGRVGFPIQPGGRSTLVLLLVVLKTTSFPATALMTSHLHYHCAESHGPMHGAWQLDKKLKRQVPAAAPASRIWSETDGQLLRILTSLLTFRVCEETSDLAG